MSDLPRLLARTPGVEGTLAGDLTRGKGSAWDLLGPGARRAPPRDPPLPEGLRHPGREGPAPPSLARASTPAAGEKLARILDGEGLLVTTGQQPLLFLGPLFVLYKIVGACALSEELEERLDVPVLPLFWVAADDHDWDEVARTRVLDLENRLRTLRLRPPADRVRRSVGPSPLPEEVAERASELFELLPESEFVDEYRRDVRDAYRAGNTFADAFVRTLAGILGDRPWAWIDSAAPAVRTAAAPLYRRLLDEADAVEEALMAGARRVRDAGYTPQVATEPGRLPLFVDRPEGRRRLLRDGRDGYRIGREGETLSRPEVEELIREEPVRFSPDVSLRPVLESWLLPVGVTLLGPAELAYWSQLGELFAWASVRTPLVRPRPSWVVVERKVGKVLEKIGAEPGDFAEGEEAVVRRHTAEERPPGVADALRDLRTAVGRAFEGVEEALGEELPGIRSAAGAARHETFEALSRLEKTVDDRVRERQAVVVEQIRKAAAHLYPDGRPQERVLSPFYHLVRYGGSFLERVEAATRDRRDGLLGPVAGGKGRE